MSKRVLIAAGLVAALAGGSLAIAQQPDPARPGVGTRRGPGGPGPRGPRGVAGDLGLRGIELTEAQREQVRTIREGHKAEFDQVRTRMRDAHRAFAEAVNAESINESTVRARSTDVANAMADEAILNAKVRAEVFAILTAEQRQQLKDRRGNRPQRQRGQ